MGRRKIQIKPIEDERSRNVTFNKRKQGLVKKAMELSILCNCEINLVVFADDKLYEYTTDDPRVILEKYCERASEPHERYSNEDYWKKFDKTGGSDDKKEKKSPAPKTTGGAAKKKAAAKETSNGSTTTTTTSSSTTKKTTKKKTDTVDDKVPLGKKNATNGRSPRSTAKSAAKSSTATSGAAARTRTMEQIVSSLPPSNSNNNSGTQQQQQQQADRTRRVSNAATNIADRQLHPPSSTKHKRKRALDQDIATMRANKKRKHALHSDLTVSIPEVDAQQSGSSQTLSVNLETPSESATPTLFSDPTASPVMTPLSSMTATSAQLDKLEWPETRTT